MKQLAALGVAVAMILGALAIRAQIEAEDEESITVDAGGTDDSALRLRCASELGAICQSLGGPGIEIIAEDAGTTADRLADPENPARPDFDVWLTDAAWPGIVADNRRVESMRGTVLDEASKVLGRSPATIAVQQSRLAGLEQACDGTITWTCIGEQAPSEISVGLPSPERGDGLIVLASAVADYFDRPDYATNDFEEDPAFSPWLRGLTQRSKVTSLGGRTPLYAAVGQSGLFQVVGALESDPGRLLPGFGAWSTIYPEPVVTSDIVLVPADGVDLADALDTIGDDQIAKALKAAGWRVPGLDPIEVVDASVELPDTQNLPNPGVLQNLRDRW